MPDVRFNVDGTMVLAGLAVAAVGYLWWRSGEIADSVSDAADEVGGAVNPADERNLINRSFNWWYGTLTGSDGTLGSDIARWQHSGGDEHWWRSGIDGDSAGTIGGAPDDGFRGGETTDGYIDSVVDHQRPGP